MKEAGESKVGLKGGEYERLLSLAQFWFGSAVNGLQQCHNTQMLLSDVHLCQVNPDELPSN